MHARLCKQYGKLLSSSRDDPHKDFHAASLSELEARLAEQLGISVLFVPAFKMSLPLRRKADPLRWVPRDELFSQSSAAVTYTSIFTPHRCASVKRVLQNNPGSAPV